jgi:hypothetical protein
VAVTPVTHCRTCGLKAGHPGIALDGEGRCNLCKLEVPPGVLQSLEPIRERFEEFRLAPANPAAEHDCLLMYSGGKDSTYALLQVSEGLGKRVLAYTFDLPYQSAQATANLELAKARVRATFVTDADKGIVTAMRAALTRPRSPQPGSYLEEKLPCFVCRSYFLIAALRYALDRGIPYVLLCADPQQMLTTEWRTHAIAKAFARAVGAKVAAETLGDALDRLLFCDEAELPKIVFPFAGLTRSYDPDRIGAEVADRGVYSSSPFATHCTLLPLLNHYSQRHWGCMVYKLNAASAVRAAGRGEGEARVTYSARFAVTEAAELLALEDELELLTMQLAAGAADPGPAEERLRALFVRLGATEAGAATVARNYVELPRIAEELGVSLEGEAP